MAFLRHGQKIFQGRTPTQGNPNWIVPKRGGTSDAQKLALKNLEDAGGTPTDNDIAAVLAYIGDLEDYGVYGSLDDTGGLALEDTVSSQTSLIKGVSATVQPNALHIDSAAGTKNGYQTTDDVTVTVTGCISTGYNNYDWFPSDANGTERRFNQTLALYFQDITQNSVPHYPFSMYVNATETARFSIEDSTANYKYKLHQTNPADVTPPYPKNETGCGFIGITRRAQSGSGSFYQDGLWRQGLGNTGEPLNPDPDADLVIGANTLATGNPVNTGPVLASIWACGERFTDSQLGYIKLAMQDFAVNLKVDGASNRFKEWVLVGDSWEDVFSGAREDYWNLHVPTMQEKNEFTQSFRYAQGSQPLSVMEPRWQAILDESIGATSNCICGGSNDISNYTGSGGSGAQDEADWADAMFGYTSSMVDMSVAQPGVTDVVVMNCQTGHSTPELVRITTDYNNQLDAAYGSRDGVHVYDRNAFVETQDGTLTAVKGVIPNGTTPVDSIDWAEDTVHVNDAGATALGVAISAWLADLRLNSNPLAGK